MRTGFERFDLALFGMDGIFCAARGLDSYGRLRSLSTLLVGIGTVTSSLYDLLDYSLTGFDATFVPALGWYTTAPVDWL